MMGLNFKLPRNFFSLIIDAFLEAASSWARDVIPGNLVKHSR